MAVSTEILNDDVKDLRKDFAASQLSLTNEINGVRVAVEKLSTRLNMVVAILGGLSLAALGLTITGLCAGFYWAGSIETSVKGLGERSKAVDARIDKLEENVNARFDKVDARMDRIEPQLSGLQSSIAKILEQTKPSR
jgi:predicted PurR-regulated permease PerM